MIDESFRSKEPFTIGASHTEHTGESDWPGGKPHRRKIGPLVRVTYEGSDRVTWCVGRHHEPLSAWIFNHYPGPIRGWLVNRWTRN